MGGHLCGVLLPENGRRSFVNHCLEPRSKRRGRAELQANVRHFELSRKRIAARMRTCQCMSHFVYNLRSRPLVRDLAARVRGQIASDHCRSDLITGLTHWARAGYPFPEVNLPETHARAHARMHTHACTRTHTRTHGLQDTVQHQGWNTFSQFHARASRLNSSRSNSSLRTMGRSAMNAPDTCMRSESDFESIVISSSQKISAI